MRILLTNDDGIASPGINILAKNLSKSHDVWIVAPEGERSASSHSITLVGPLMVKRKSDRTFACRGTPVDCVLLAFKDLIKVEFDCVISGINMGPNLGTDILYSGTVGAARQGALMEKPSIAVSVCAKHNSLDFNIPARFLENNMERFVELWSPGHFLNINFPDVLKDQLPVSITYPSKRIYRDKLKTFSAPDGYIYCFFEGDSPGSQMEKGSDHFAIINNMISISPIQVHPAKESVMERYEAAIFWRGS